MIRLEFNGRCTADFDPLFERNAFPTGRQELASADESSAAGCLDCRRAQHGHGVRMSPAHAVHTVGL